MGKIKSSTIKRVAEELIKKGIEFTTDFEKNKKILDGLTESKKTRNQIAGYLVRLKKRQLKEAIKED